MKIKFLSISTFVLLWAVLTSVADPEKVISISDLHELTQDTTFTESNNFLVSKGWEFTNSKNATQENFGWNMWSYDYDKSTQSSYAWIRSWYHFASPLKRIITLCHGDSELQKILVKQMETIGLKFQSEEILSDGTIQARYWKETKVGEYFSSFCVCTKAENGSVIYRISTSVNCTEAQ